MGAHPARGRTCPIAAGNEQPTQYRTMKVHAHSQEIKFS
jgi:hypothetical protein